MFDMRFCLGVRSDVDVDDEDIQVVEAPVMPVFDVDFSDNEQPPPSKQIKREEEDY